MAGNRVYVATESGSVDVKGEVLTFTKGVTRAREGHPILKAVPACFELADEHVHYDVEKATAAPGEKRERTKAPAKAKADAE